MLTLPWIAGYALDSRDPGGARRAARAAGMAVRDLPGGRLAVALPGALGGVVVFQPPGSGIAAFD